MGTGFHAVDASGMRPGDVVAVLGLGPVGPVRGAGRRGPAAPRTCSRSTPSPSGSRSPSRYGAEAVHLGEQDARAIVRAATEGRGVDVCIDAVGDPKVLESAIRLTRACGSVQCIGVYAERAEVHMGCCG